MMQVFASRAQQLVSAPVLRSIWPSLTSAASTLALIGAANWGIADFIGQESRRAFYPVLVLGLPLLPLLLSLKNASSVWFMKQSIHGRHRRSRDFNVQVDSTSVAILCGCPLFIQVPLSAISKESDVSRHFNDRGYTDLHEKYPKDDCPLELTPRDTPALNSDQEEKKYLKLSMKYFNFDNIQERQVLLTLGLVPESRQLLFLRSRSRFQTVVTALQAAGYLLGVGQRLVEHRAVCPLEALLCFLSVIILFQLLLEFYACSHYARPLLLCLNHDQFSEFWKADRASFSYRHSIKRHRIIPHVIVLVLVVMLFSGISILYSMHYMNSCNLCSASAFLFVFALFAWAVGFGFVVSKQSVPVPATLLWIFSALTFVCSMVLAVVSTTIHWDLFHWPTSYSFSWILPHVSS